MNVFGPGAFGGWYWKLNISLEGANGTSIKSSDGNNSIYHIESVEKIDTLKTIDNVSVNKTFTVQAPNSDGNYPLRLHFEMQDTSDGRRPANNVFEHSFDVYLHDEYGEVIYGIGFGEKLSADANKISAETNKLILVLALVAIIIGIPTAAHAVSQLFHRVAGADGPSPPPPRSPPPVVVEEGDGRRTRIFFIAIIGILFLLTVRVFWLAATPGSGYYLTLGGALPAVFIGFILLYASEKSSKRISGLLERIETRLLKLEDLSTELKDLHRTIKEDQKGRERPCPRRMPPAK